MISLGYLYVVGNGAAVKIGKSCTPEARIAALGAASAQKLVTYYIGATNGDPGAIERRAHAILAPFRLNGEWFSAAPQAAITAVETASRDIGQPLMRCDQRATDIGPATERVGIWTAFARGHKAIWKTDLPFLDKLTFSVLRVIIGVLILGFIAALSTFAGFLTYLALG